jgi:predicted nicotinamide N-methyase
MSKQPSKQPTDIKELLADPNNRRRHTARNVGLLVDSLQKVGAARSIVIDENNEVLAGNATIEAAAEAGITKLKVVEADGQEVIAVRRSGLTPDQKRNLAIYDNRTGELAEWNLEQLLKDVEDGVDLSAFFHDDELKSLMDAAKDIDLDTFFEEDPNVDAALVNLILKFNTEDHARVLKALDELCANGSKKPRKHEEIIMKWLELD